MNILNNFSRKVLSEGSLNEGESVLKLMKDTPYEIWGEIELWVDEETYDENDVKKDHKKLGDILNKKLPKNLQVKLHGIDHNLNFDKESRRGTGDWLAFQYKVEGNVYEFIYSINSNILAFYGVSMKSKKRETYKNVTTEVAIQKFVDYIIKENS